MADKQVEIEVNAKTDLSEVQELNDLVEQIQENASEGITVDTSGLDDAESSAEALNTELENIDGTVVTPEVDTSSLENAQATAEETASSMDNITTAATGLAATAGFEQMAETADNINTSWNRLELTFQGTGVSMDELRGKASALTESTGRSGGVIRDYFNQMGIAGVTNTDLIASSFEALSGKAYQTGNSIESMEQKMQMMAMSGNASTRMLKYLGITAEDLATAMGVSADEVSEAFKNMTPEERIQALTTAMGSGTRANEMYKNSFAGLKDQANAAMAGLMGAIGQAILPIVVPALQAATSLIKLLTDGFKALPGPVQAVIGGIGGFAAIITTAVGVLGILGSVIGTVRSGLTVLRSITLLETVATQAATAAQWLWNAAMTANPIGILIVAIGALIAILVYLYFNNEQVRQSIDNIAASIMSVLTPAIEWISSLFNQFTNQLGLNTNDWTQAVLAFILFIPQLPMKVGLALADALAKALGFKGSFTSYIKGAAKDAVDGFVTWIVGIYNKFKEEVDKILAEADRLARELPPKVAKSGLGVVGGWIDTTGEHSPGYMYEAFSGELKAMLSLADKTSHSLPGSILNMGSSMVDGFNPNLESNNITGSGAVAGNMTINIEIGSVDNDERVQEIVDAVRRALAWNNRTAGRTV